MTEDFIDDTFLPLTRGIRTPPAFCLWGAISLVAGAVERRVWVRNSYGNIYPNMYIVLVAPPGVGKFVIETVKDLWSATNELGTKVPAFSVASDSVSYASLVDELAEAKKSRVTSDGVFTYNSLLVAAEEFQVLLPSFIPELIGKFNSLYNNKSSYRETRRTGNVREVIIDRPTLNMLCGAQPSYFSSTFPEEAWSTGFARRIIMVYATDTPRLSLFHDFEIAETETQKVLKWLSRASECYGLLRWEPAAAKKIDDWFMSGEAPAPTHSKLEHYSRSRAVFIHKLAMISSLSRDLRDMVIREGDIARAMDWLFEAERSMPDVFRAMVGKSDIQVIEELHLHLSAEWVRNKQKPIGTDYIMRFLISRVPSDKAKNILWAAEQSNVIMRYAGTETYRPVAKMEWEVE